MRNIAADWGMRLGLQSRRIPAVPRPNTDVTRLLRRWRDGDDEALHALVPVVETELRRLARGYMRRERRDHTLQTTALVNEAFIRIAGARDLDWQDRAHFFAISARLMRQILVDHARARIAGKRGGAQDLVALDESAGRVHPRSVDLLALDEALGRLEAIDPRKVRVVELRFFGGLTTAETAAALNVSDDTVKRDFRFAKLWLLRELAASLR
jgi:RNA polymerase sigma factor (TIGR02999 family)